MYIERIRPMYDISNRVQVTNPTVKSKWAKNFNVTDSEWKFIDTLLFQFSKDCELRVSSVSYISITKSLSCLQKKKMS